MIAIDQQPIGRTPRSNPGTYTKAFDLIRDIFAELPDARARGWDAGRFSFNVKGGRCETCDGDGMVKVEMHFLADVYVPCEACGTRRYNARDARGAASRASSIADVLESSVDECLELFAAFPALSRVLDTLGRGRPRLHEDRPARADPERRRGAARQALVASSGKVQTGRTLYVLDEPTTGLHFEDITQAARACSQRLVEAGNTVVVIEHNLDVVKCADWVIDLGPEGGARGGRVIAEGTPEQVAARRGVVHRAASGAAPVPQARAITQPSRFARPLRRTSDR